MTAAARGNVAVAVFNATLSNIIGVFLTPLWIGAVLKVSGQGLELGPVIFDLVRWLIVPLVLGQLCRPWIADWIKRHKPGVHMVDRGTILLLVYTSFCGSFKDRLWSAHGAGTIALVVVASGAIFAIVMVFTARVSRAMGFPREDTIAAMFCGSKKTLASGVPMAKLIFGTAPGLGLILLPIMIYHQLQLIACGVLVNAWNRRTHEETGTQGDRS
jgi:sodium/bile acid cotransporter 7